MSDAIHELEVGGLRAWLHPESGCGLLELIGMEEWPDSPAACDPRDALAALEVIGWAPTPPLDGAADLWQVIGHSEVGRELISLERQSWLAPVDGVDHFRIAFDLRCAVDAA